MGGVPKPPWHCARLPLSQLTPAPTTQGRDPGDARGAHEGRAREGHQPHHQYAVQECQRAVAATGRGQLPGPRPPGMAWCNQG